MDTGWTFYTPYSSTYTTTNVVPVMVGIFITGFSSILTGLNFIVTIHTMRAPGLDLVPAAALYLVDLCHQPDPGAGDAGAGHHAVAPGRMEHLVGVGIFDPALGGDPVLFQHLFWFYSHPAVYIMILPAHGRRQRDRRRASRAKRSSATAFVGFCEPRDRGATVSWSGDITCS